MNKILLLCFFCSCSHVTKIISAPPGGLVTVQTALDHIKASYMRGCVEAFITLNIPKSFEYCRDQAEKHRLEVEEIIEQPTE